MKCGRHFWPRSMVLHLGTVGFRISQHSARTINDSGACMRGGRHFSGQLLKRNRTRLAVGAPGKHLDFVLEVALKLSGKRRLPTSAHKNVQRGGRDSHHHDDQQKELKENPLPHRGHVLDARYMKAAAGLSPTAIMSHHLRTSNIYPAPRTV